MRALRWIGQGRVELGDVGIPKLQSHEVLIKVRSSTICGTDLHIVSKGFPGMVPPLTLGHEFAGEVAQIGSDVKSVSVGERVAVEPVRICHNCSYCNSGRYQLCNDFQEAGFHYDGGLAEYVVADARFVYPLPESVSFASASVLEPIGNIVRAADRGRVGDASSVVVIGDGFEGLLFAQLAKRLAVPQVIVVGHSDYKLQMALETGTDHVINGHLTDAIEEVTAMTAGLGGEVVFEAAGTPHSIQQALAVTRKGGRMVLFGVCNDPVPLNVYRIMQDEIEIIGSVGNAGAWPRGIQYLTERRIDVSPYLRVQREFKDAQIAFEQMMRRELSAVKLVLNM